MIPKWTFQKWISILGTGACLINCFFLIPQCAKAFTSFHGAWGLTNLERRYLQKGEWYRVMLDIENTIPRAASIRLVSPAPPWYLSYYLYPRLLRSGSLRLEDQEKIRLQYPSDWVLVYSETPPKVSIYPPERANG
jgi:hypothetical protein